MERRGFSFSFAFFAALRETFSYLSSSGKNFNPGAGPTYSLNGL